MSSIDIFGRFGKNCRRPVHCRAEGPLRLPDSLITGVASWVVCSSSEPNRLTVPPMSWGGLRLPWPLTFNAQHALGQGSCSGRANGDAGFNGNFFQMTDMQPGVKPYSVNNNGWCPCFDGCISSIRRPFGPQRADGNYYTTLKTS